MLFNRTFFCYEIIKFSDNKLNNKHSISSIRLKISFFDIA